MKRIVALGVILALSWTGAALAGDLKGLLAAAGAQAEQGLVMEMINTLRQTLAEAWTRIPLTIRKAVLVNKKPEAFGSYEARQDAVYRANESVLLYLEPVGYCFKSQGEWYNFSLAVDVTFLSAEGKVLAGQRDFGQWSFTSRERVFEFFLYLTLNLTGAPPGRYLIETTLRDRNDGDRATITTPVTFE